MIDHVRRTVRRFAAGMLFAAAVFAALPAASAEWRVGLAAAKITPEGPIRMAGYISRDKPSEGVLADLYAEAMAVEDAGGHRAVLLTSDVIGYNRPVAEMIFARIAKRTGLKRPQILLSCSHTHTGPVIGIPGATTYSMPEEHAKRVHGYTEGLAGTLVDLSVAALADLRPAKLSFGVGKAGFVMNRRLLTDRGVRMSANREGNTDTDVPVLRVDGRDGAVRALLFGCACHNTTLTGKHYQICGGYAGFAKEYVEKEHPGAAAMFMAGCGADANPHPRGEVDHARQHGKELGAEVCRVASGELRPVSGPLCTLLGRAVAPLEPVPSREELEKLVKGPHYLAYNYRRMLEAVEKGEPLRTTYDVPIAVWQFGEDLTLVALSGEVVSEYVPLIHGAIGKKGLWVAGYCNDAFGYLPTRKILREGGYETRCLIPEAGFFAPEAEGVVVAEIRRLAEAAGRAMPE